MSAGLSCLSVQYDLAQVRLPVLGIGCWKAASSIPKVQIKLQWHGHVMCCTGFGKQDRSSGTSTPSWQHSAEHLRAAEAQAEGAASFSIEQNLAGRNLEGGSSQELCDQMSSCSGLLSERISLHGSVNFAAYWWKMRTKGTVLAAQSVTKPTLVFKARADLVGWGGRGSLLQQICTSNTAHLIKYPPEREQRGCFHAI